MINDINKKRSLEITKWHAIIENRDNPGLAYRLDLKVGGTPMPGGDIAGAIASKIVSFIDDPENHVPELTLQNTAEIRNFWDKHPLALCCLETSHAKGGRMGMIVSHVSLDAPLTRPEIRIDLHDQTIRLPNGKIMTGYSFDFFGMDHRDPLKNAEENDFCVNHEALEMLATMTICLADGLDMPTAAAVAQAIQIIFSVKLHSDFSSYFMADNLGHAMEWASRLGIVTIAGGKTEDETAWSTGPRIRQALTGIPPQARSAVRQVAKRFEDPIEFRNRLEWAFGNRDDETVPLRGSYANAERATSHEKLKLHEEIDGMALVLDRLDAVFEKANVECQPVGVEMIDHIQALIHDEIDQATD